MALFFTLGIAGVLIYCFIAVARWANASRHGRETGYKSESIRRVTGARKQSTEFLQGSERFAARPRRLGYKQVGLISLGLVLCMMMAIAAVDHTGPHSVHFWPGFLSSINSFFILILYVSFWGVVLYSLLAVARWANMSRREKEAYYKSERFRKIAESPGVGNSSVIEFLQGEERIAACRRREGQKLGGLITIAVGLSMMIFIGAVGRKGSEPV